jgi:hypothetical protein
MARAELRDENKESGGKKRVNGVTGWSMWTDSMLMKSPSNETFRLPTAWRSIRKAKYE